MEPLFNIHYFLADADETHKTNSEDNKSLFFDDINYSSFKKDILEFNLQKNTPQTIQIVNESSPYLFIVKTFALLKENQIPLLVSAKMSARQFLEISKTVEDFNLNKNKNIPDELKKENLIAFLSSGSTGTPKIIIHSLSTLFKSAESFHQYFSIKNKVTHFFNLPINHVGGFMLLIRAIYNYSRVITRPLNNQIDFLSLVPSQIEKCFSLLPQNDPAAMETFHLMKTCQALLIGGAALNDSLKKLLDKNQIPYFETYGMTETASFIVLNHQVLPDRKIIINPEGLVCLQSPTLFLGTIRDNRFYSRTEILYNQESYYPTNDLGEFRDQKFYFLNRADQVIISGGEKISIQKISEILKNASFFNEFKLVGIKDEYWGEKLVCFFDQAKLSPTEMNQILKTQIEYFEIPKAYVQFPFKQNNGMKITYEDFYHCYLNSLFDFNYIPATKNNHNRTLIILHGFMETSQDWITLFDEVKDANLLFINLPGHGTTKIENFLHIDDFFQKLKEFIYNFTSTPIFIGYSMGGRVALKVSQFFINPQLILISSGIGLATDEERNLRKKTDAELFSQIHHRDDLKEFFQAWYKNPIFIGYQNSENYQKDIENKLNADYHQWQKAINLLTPANFPLFDESVKYINQYLKNIYYLYGENDEKYKKAAIYFKENALEIKEAAHNLHRTHAKELKRVLINILKKLT